MATPADQRLLELLDKWLKSLELHLKYSTLDDDSYWKIQPWVEHQRPSGWILDLAKQKTIALQSYVEERIKMGDSKFADALELMIFLANLVGSEHIERFIPLAEAQNERPVALQAPDDSPTIATSMMSGTREMPPFVAAKRAPPPAGTAQVARTERQEPKAAKAAAKAAEKAAAKAAGARGAAAKGAALREAVSKDAAPTETAPKAAAPAHAARAPDRAGAADAAREQVIADAARLVQWGRKWYELPELIARMADRPPLSEVRRILKENKSAIDRKAEGA
jgi:hypothetical protein